MQEKTVKHTKHNVSSERGNRYYINNRDKNKNVETLLSETDTDRSVYLVQLYVRGMWSERNKRLVA